MWLAIARFVGVHAAAQLSSRLPRQWGWLLSVAVMVVVNLTPIVTLLRGDWGVPDMLLFYAIENCVIVVAGLVRIMTFGTGIPSVNDRIFAVAFYGMFFGIFTLVATLLAFIGADMNGLHGSPTIWAVNLVLLFVGTVLALAFFWFGQQQYLQATPAPIYLATIPRVAALHFFVIFLAFAPPMTGVPPVVWIMVIIKIVWDFGLMTAELLNRPRKAD